jgi:hypothetical protein
LVPAAQNDADKLSMRDQNGAPYSAVPPDLAIKTG